MISNLGLTEYDCWLLCDFYMWLPLLQLQTMEEISKILYLRPIEYDQVLILQDQLSELKQETKLVRWLINYLTHYLLSDMHFSPEEFKTLKRNSLEMIVWLDCHEEIWIDYRLKRIIHQIRNSLDIDESMQEIIHLINDSKWYRTVSIDIIERYIEKIKL